MSQEQLQANWKQLKGKIKAKLGDLTDDDLLEAEGNFDSLVGKIAERYAMTKEKAEKKLSKLLESFDDESSNAKSVADDMAECVDEMGEKCNSTVAYAKKTIRKNPMASAGICLAVGALLGMLITK